MWWHVELYKDTPLPLQTVQPESYPPSRDTYNDDKLYHLDMHSPVYLIGYDTDLIKYLTENITYLPQYSYLLIEIQLLLTYESSVAVFVVFKQTIL